MQFNKIEEIQIGNNKNGVVESDGNVFAIISANYEQNYSESPSKFTIGLVGSDSSVEMNEYLGLDLNGNTKIGGRQDETFAIRNMETITIKNATSDIFVFNGFLISFSESISAGERTYQIEYVDRSVILDKIFVGISNRHEEVTNPVGGEATVWALCGAASELKDGKIKFGVKEGLGPKLNTARAFAFANRKLSFIEYHSFDPKEYFAGGKIIVGDEQFTENFCSVPPVDYSFKDLIDGMGNAGIAISSANLSALSSAAGLRREYSGTLRSVMKSWCADYGLFFVWDESAGRSKHGAGVSFFDMRAGVGDLVGLKKSLLERGVENIEFSRSKENTQVKALTTRMIRPPSIEEKSINFSRRVPCTPITLDQISSANEIVRPRHPTNSFLMSCMLAKANADLRTIWYITKSVEGTFRWEALGLYLVRNMADKTYWGTRTKSILKSAYIEDYSQIAIDFNTNNGYGINVNNVELHLVYRSEDMANRFLEWEKTIADDFVGKYWRTTSRTLQPDTSSCASLYGRRAKIAESNPSFIDSSDEIIPEISMDPYGGKINAHSNFRSTPLGTGMSSVVKRDTAPWATDLNMNNEKDIKDIIPRFVPVTVEHYDTLVEAGIIETDVLQSFSMGGANFQLGFLFVRRDLSDKIKFEAKVVDNPLEKTDLEINAYNSEGEIDKCKPNCSIDIGQFVCGDTTYNGSNLQPAVTSKQCQSIEISTGSMGSINDVGIRGTIFSPTGSDRLSRSTFNRIETIDFSSFLSRRALKSFKSSWIESLDGKLVGPLQSASIDVIDEDMTSSILFSSSTNGNNTVINGVSYIVKDGWATNMGAVTGQTNAALEGYHDGIKKTLAPSNYFGEQALSASIPGFKLNREDFTIKNGLSSISFSMGSDGSDTSVSFRSTPRLPLARDLMVPTIKTITSHFRN